MDDRAGTGDHRPSSSGECIRGRSGNGRRREARPRLHERTWPNGRRNPQCRQLAIRGRRVRRRVRGGPAASEGVAVMAPFYELGRFGDGMSFVIAVLLGIAFGWFLERGGMGNARKLSGQFYLTDLSVLKLMFSAIVTAMLGLFWLSWAGLLDLSRVYVPETFIAPQLVGGLVFGVGFATGGLCPGTSCVAAATGRGDGMM